MLSAAALLPAPGECVGLLSSAPAARLDLLTHIARAAGADPLIVGGVDVLFPGLDVAGNIDFALAPRAVGRTERRRRCAELLALAGLDPLATRRVHQLDPEQRAACLLARAVATGHRTLLLDDPFGGLDEAPRTRLQAMLRRMVAVERTAVVLASASRREMLDTADRIGVEEAGGIRRLGTVAELFQAPASAVEAAQIAEANLLVGRIESVDPDDDRDATVRLACGTAMPAQRHEDTEAGGLCLVAIRPDHIAFAALEADALGGTALPATLVEHRQAGDQLRLRLRLADGTLLAVRRPAAAVTTRELARASLPDGASVAWRASQATAFPHPEG